MKSCIITYIQRERIVGVGVREIGRVPNIRSYFQQEVGQALVFVCGHVSKARDAGGMGVIDSGDIQIAIDLLHLLV